MKQVLEICITPVAETAQKVRKCIGYTIKRQQIELEVLLTTSPSLFNLSAENFIAG